MKCIFCRKVIYCGKFCNRKCYFNYVKKKELQKGVNNNWWTGGKIKFICGMCGKIKYFWKCRTKRNNKNYFCNLKCYGRWQSKNRIGQKHHFFGKHHSAKTIKKLKISCRRSSKKLFNDKSFVKRFRSALHLKPNKKERILNCLLKKLFNNEYKYTGDFKKIIERKSPDFVSESKQKIIELFGNYWHKKCEEKRRINLFKKYGYETIIVWENELENIEKLKKKLVNFNKK